MMSMGNSGLFEITAGARALKTDAPIGFDETPPEMPEPERRADHAETA